MPKCNGHKHGGEPCGAWALTGLDKCRMHAGTTSEVAKAEARRRIDADEARQAALDLGLIDQAGPIDPRDVFELELWRTHLTVQLYDAMVADLPLDELYAETWHANGQRTGRALPHVLVQMRDAERLKLVAIAATAHKAGVENRRVELEQAKLDLVERAFEAMLEELKLNATQKQEARQTYARHLRAVA